MVDSKTPANHQGPEAEPSKAAVRKVKWDYARNLWELGIDLLSRGNLPEAVRTFNESIGVLPTAEGYTFRGWAISFLHHYEEAIDDCKKAIAINPDFGNPYNDIGIYLMRLGRLEEAESWLQKATHAKEYEPRHFPYLNLGQIYMLWGKQDKALDAFVKALEFDPENEIARQHIASMEMTF